MAAVSGKSNKKPITSIALDEICEIHKDFEPFVDNI